MQSVVHTETDVANEALSACKAAPLLSLDAADTEKARLLRQHFAPVRDTLQRLYVWNFNEAFLSLPEGGGAIPDGFGYSHRFPFTTDMLGVRDVVGCGRRDWKVQGRSIVAAVSGPLKVVASVRVPAVEVWDPLFRTTFVASLAYAIAPRLSTDDELIERLRRAAQDALAQATPIDAGEGDPEQPEEQDVILSRF